jgi:hypothetical protein
VQITADDNLVGWAFGRDIQSPLNNNIWYKPWVLQPDADPSVAINEFFSSQAYVTGCKYASMFVLLKGILDTVGPNQFDLMGLYHAGNGYTEIGEQALYAGIILKDQLPATKGGSSGEWVPGDRGWINGHGGGSEAGEFIIYAGGPEGFEDFWGFGGRNWKRRRSFSEWITAVDGMRGATNATDSGQRFYPGVGLVDRSKR